MGEDSDARDGEELGSCGVTLTGLVLVDIGFYWLGLSGFG